MSKLNGRKKKALQASAGALKWPPKSAAESACSPQSLGTFAIVATKLLRSSAMNMQRGDEKNRRLPING